MPNEEKMRRHQELSNQILRAVDVLNGMLEMAERAGLVVEIERDETFQPRFRLPNNRMTPSMRLIVNAYTPLFLEVIPSDDPQKTKSQDFENL